MKTSQFRKAASNERKSIRTRALLMDAAISVISSKGVEATTVSDIIAVSEVSQGTFYYHFDGKEAVVDAVAKIITTSLVDQTDHEVSHFQKGVERVALGTAVFITLGAQDRDWARLVVDALCNAGPMQDGISRGIRKDVALGVQQNDLASSVSDLMFQSSLAIVGTAVRVCIAAPKELPRVRLESSSLVLRLLGADPAAYNSLPAQVWDDYVAKTHAEPLLRLPRGLDLTEELLSR